MSSSRFETGSLATVFGGSGFVGRYVVRELARKGWRIRAAERRPDLAGFLQPMGGVGQVQPVQANLRFPDSVAAVLEGADAAVNLVGVLHKVGPQTFDALHVEGARAVARAARAAGVKRLVHVSAIGADPKSPGKYGRSKAAGEAAVLEEFPDAIIVRPNVIFGPEDQFLNRFADMSTLPTLPFFALPLFGSKTRLQPVYVGDVGEAIANALDGMGTPGSVYELGGPDTETLRGLVERCETWTGRHKAVLPLPFWLAKLIGLATVVLPNSIRPFTVDQVRMLERDCVVSADAAKDGRTLAGLGVATSTTIAAVAPTYLERFQPKGQYAHYRG